MGIADPVQLLATRDVAEELGLHPRSAGRVMAGGLCGPVFTSKSASYVALAALGELKTYRPLADPHEPLSVIRVAAIRPSPDADRDWEGWHQELYLRDPSAALDAITRWWQVRDPELGRLFVFCLGGFSVWSGRLRDFRTLHGLRALELEPELDPRYQKLRLETGPGGNLIDLPAS